MMTFRRRLREIWSIPSIRDRDLRAPLPALGLPDVRPSTAAQRLRLCEQ